MLFYHRFAPSGDSLRSQSLGHSVNYRIPHVIANQCSHWCGNPPVLPRIIASRMSLRTSVATLVWQSVTQSLPLGKVPEERGRMRAKAPLDQQGELSRASPASTRLRGSELSYFDNPSVKNQRFLPAPFTQGSRWGAPAPVRFSIVLGMFRGLPHQCCGTGSQ